MKVLPHTTFKLCMWMYPSRPLAPSRRCSFRFYILYRSLYIAVWKQPLARPVYPHLNTDLLSFECSPCISVDIFFGGYQKTVISFLESFKISNCTYQLYPRNLRVSGEYKNHPVVGLWGSRSFSSLSRA